MGAGGPDLNAWSPYSAQPYLCYFGCYFARFNAALASRPNIQTSFLPSRWKHHSDHYNRNVDGNRSSLQFTRAPDNPSTPLGSALPGFPQVLEGVLPQRVLPQRVLSLVSHQFWRVYLWGVHPQRVLPLS